MGVVDAEPLLVCLPPSGAGRTFFRSWPRRIGGARVLPLSRPGHEERMREPLAGSLVAVADDVAGRLRRQGGQPIILFGHSLGAIVAFETARRLCAQHEAAPAVSLVVSARQAPQLPSVAPAEDDGFLAQVLSWGGYETELDDALASVLLPALRADLALSVGYRWDGSPVPVPVTAVAYAEDPVVAVEAVRAWSASTTGSFRARVLEGGHFAARDAPASLITLLEEVVSGSSRPDHRAGVLLD